MPASLIKDKQVKFFTLAKNTHPWVTRSEAEGSIERKGKAVHVKMVAIRSHFAPDNHRRRPGRRHGLFHVTNLEQDWDILHGFAVLGMNNAELLLHAGRDAHPDVGPAVAGCLSVLLHRLLFGAAPGDAGVYPGSAPGAGVPLKANTSAKAKTQVGRLDALPTTPEHQHGTSGGR